MHLIVLIIVYKLELFIIEIAFYVKLQLFSRFSRLPIILVFTGNTIVRILSYYIMINLPYNCLKIFLLILTNSQSLLKLVLKNIKVFLFTSLIDLEMNTLKCVF